MKTILIFSILTYSVIGLNAQKIITKTGHIWIYSYTPFEEIEAHNHQVAGILNTDDGTLQISMLIKSFEFKRSLMQEHFNENYMESDKLPKSTFVGKISTISNINFKKNGTYPATAEGDLTIHGVTKKVTITGNITVEGKNILLKSKFQAVPQDYDIIIPDLMSSKIATLIDINVELPFIQN